MDSLGPQQQKVTQIGHQTTVETAQRISNPISKAGNKRARDQLCSVSKCHDVPTTLPGSTNQSTRNDFDLSISTSQTKQLRASTIKGFSSECSRLQKRSSIYSQRRAIASTLTTDRNPILSFAHPAYSLPEKLIQNFSALGIDSIYPWQSKCLLESRLLNGEGNLVYTAPTGGGKSLVADVLMLKQVVDNPHKKAILVLPYVALVQEKLRWLRRAVDGVTRKTSQEQHPTVLRRRGDEDTIRIFGFFGGGKSRASWADMDIAVCTIEKVS
jgi:hypothetical protein